MSDLVGTDGGDSMNEEREQMRQRKRQIKKQRLLRNLMLVFVVLVAFYVFLNSEYFMINEVKVDGLVYIEPEEIRQYAAVSAGTKLWEVNERELADRLKRHPRVKDVEIVRDLPSGLTIKIEERIPVGLVPYHGNYLEVDREGRVLALRQGTKVDLPVITGIELERQLVGDIITVAGFQNVTFCATSLGDLQVKISEINLRDDGTIVMYTNDGIPIYFGQASEQTERKLKDLAAILIDIWSNDLDVIEVDVSVPGRPVIKPK